MWDDLGVAYHIIVARVVTAGREYDTNMVVQLCNMPKQIVTVTTSPIPKTLTLRIRLFMAYVNLPAYKPSFVVNERSYGIRITVMRLVLAPDPNQPQRGSLPVSTNGSGLCWVGLGLGPRLIQSILGTRLMRSKNNGKGHLPESTISIW